MKGEAYVKVVAWIGLMALVLVAAPAAKAGDFDGSKPLLCAPVEVIDCVPGVPCFADTPAEMGAPAFLRIDFKKKTVTGPHAVAEIAALEKSDAQLLLQGVEIGHAFAIALDRESGRMTVTLSNVNGAFVLFGSCTPF
jgi:hypothetical protein